MHTAHLISNREVNGITYWTIALIVDNSKVVLTVSGDGSYVSSLARLAQDAANYNHSAAVYASMA